MAVRLRLEAGQLLRVGRTCVVALKGLVRLLALEDRPAVKREAHGCRRDDRRGQFVRVL